MRTTRGVMLRFFIPEGEKFGGELLYEWLLEEAKRLGVPGGSAFRAVAGYGRHGVLHEQTFFELAGELPVEVVFALSADEADRILARLAERKLSLFFVRTDAEFGIVDGGPSSG